MARSQDVVRLLPVGGTRASLAIDGPATATFNTIVRATDEYEGPAGNAITLAIADGGTWVPNVGTLTLVANVTAEVAAELDLDTVTGDLDTIIEAAAPGVEGNDITVTVVGDSAPAAGVTISEVGNLVTIHFEDGVSTVGDVEAAITAEAALIAVKTTGTGATVLDAATDECTAESLAGGLTEGVTIGSTVYLFRDSGKVDAAYDVLIGASAEATLDNLIAAINANGLGDGTDYGAGTVEHTQVRAFAGAGDTMVVHTKPAILTAVGTLIATTDDMANAGNVWGAATLADGTDGDNVVFTVTGTAIACVFSASYTCVEDFEAALAADADVAALIEIGTAGTTPLYRLVTTNDEFAATNLTAGGATTKAAPTAGTFVAAGQRPFYADEALVTVRSVDDVTSITKTVTPVLWGWHPVIEDWFEIGTLNSGSAIGEQDSDRIAYCEVVQGIGEFSHFWCELSVTGSGTEVEVQMSFVRPGAHD
jgi:hypothetical protein